MIALEQIDRIVGNQHHNPFEILGPHQVEEDGKLREGVHAFLGYHPQVARFELAGEKDGGGGVTIAYLK